MVCFVGGFAPRGDGGQCDFSGRRRTCCDLCAVRDDGGEGHDVGRFYPRERARVDFGTINPKSAK